MHLISYDVTYLFMIMWEGVRKGVNLEMENCCKIIIQIYTWLSIKTSLHYFNTTTVKQSPSLLPVFYVCLMLARAGSGCDRDNQLISLNAR